MVYRPSILALAGAFPVWDACRTRTCYVLLPLGGGGEEISAWNLWIHNSEIQLIVFNGEMSLISQLRGLKICFHTIIKVPIILEMLGQSFVKYIVNVVFGFLVG